MGSCKSLEDEILSFLRNPEKLALVILENLSRYMNNVHAYEFTGSIPSTDMLTISCFLILWVEGQLFKHVFNPLRDIVLALE